MGGVAGEDKGGSNGETLATANMKIMVNWPKMGFLVRELLLVELRAMRKKLAVE